MRGSLVGKYQGYIPMNTYESDPQVGGGSRDEKPCRIVLRTGEQIDAAYHFVNKHGWVCVYETERSGGIDLRFPPSAVKWIDTRDATVTDNVAPGDQVKARGETWTVLRSTAGIVELEPETRGARAMCPESRAGDGPVIDVPVSEVTVIETANRGEA